MQYVARKSALALLFQLEEAVSQFCGVPGGIRTHDPLLRRQPLYPTELQGQGIVYHSNVAQGLGEVKGRNSKGDN